MLYWRIEGDAHQAAPQPGTGDRSLGHGSPLSELGKREDKKQTINLSSSQSFKSEIGIRQSAILDQPSWPRPPLPVLDGLREAFLKNAARNALLYHDLAQVLTAFQAAGIHAAVLKGAHLAALVYPHIGCRTMADIDLLVPADEVSRTDALLRSLGYSPLAGQPLNPVPSPTPKHLPEYHKASHPRIEIHLTIAHPQLPLDVDLPGLHSRLRPVTIAGVATHVLSLEDALLYQCTHLAGHRFACHGLRPLCDLALTLSRQGAELDSALLVSRAREWRASPATYLALRLSTELIHAEIPGQVLGQIRDEGFDETYYDLARESVLTANSELVPEALAPEDGRLRKLTDGVTENPWSSKIRAVWRLLFPGRGHMAIYMRQFHGQALTGHRRWTCYLVRAWDLIPRGVRYLRHASSHRGEAARRGAQLRREARLWRWLTDPSD